MINEMRKDTGTGDPVPVLCVPGTGYPVQYITVTVYTVKVMQCSAMAPYSLLFRLEFNISVHESTICLVLTRATRLLFWKVRRGERRTCQTCSYIVQSFHWTVSHNIYNSSVLCGDPALRFCSGNLISKVDSVLVAMCEKTEYRG